MRIANLLLVLPLIWGASLSADSHFSINLNAPLGCLPSTIDTSCPTNSGGWDANQSFNAQANTGLSTEGFVEGSSCGGVACPILTAPLLDPDMELDLGGFSLGIDSLNFSFSANANGGGILDFFNNSGQHWSDLEIITALDPNKFYDCGSTAFLFCGFRVDLADSSKLDILYSGGTGIDTVPEPASWLLLLTGLAVPALVRRRSVPNV